MVEIIPPEDRVPLPSPEGKPGINWDRLYIEWVNSGIRKSAFLRRKGLDPMSTIVKSATDVWSHAAAKAKAELINATSGRHGKPADVLTVNEIYQLVQGWRKRQARADYETAEALRNHVKLTLNDATETIHDKMGGPSVVKSKLNTNQIKQLAMALVDIQKIQRLALGLSTENIGIEAEVNAGREITPDDLRESVFQVEVNSNGKFVAARPRLVSDSRPSDSDYDDLSPIPPDPEDVEDAIY